MRYSVITVLIFTAAILFCRSLNPDEPAEDNTPVYTLGNIYLKTDEEAPPITAVYADKLSYADTTAEVAFIKNTDDLPRDFMLSCVSRGKIPYIVIEEGAEIFDLDHIRNIAEELSFFNTTTYIELYPLYAKPSFNYAAYRTFYKDATEIIKNSAPKTQIVWALSQELIYEESELAPPISSFDFVGLSLICGLNGDFNLQTIYDKAEYLNLTYPQPIIITRFAVTEYSEKSHSYYKSQKESCINEVINNLPAMYPNIVGIIAFESSAYSYEGYNNRLSFSDGSAAALLLNSLREFQNKADLAKKLPYTALIYGYSAYVAADDYPKISPTPYTSVLINDKSYINLSRTQKTDVSEKNRSVIIYETVL